MLLATGWCYGSLIGAIAAYLAAVTLRLQPESLRLVLSSCCGAIRIKTVSTCILHGTVPDASIGIILTIDTASADQ